MVEFGTWSSNIELSWTLLFCVFRSTELVTSRSTSKGRTQTTRVPHPEALYPALFNDVWSDHRHLFSQVE